MFVPDGVKGLRSDSGLKNIFHKIGFLPVVDVLLANLQGEGREKGRRESGEGGSREGGHM